MALSGLSYFFREAGLSSASIPAYYDFRVSGAFARSVAPSDGLNSGILSGLSPSFWARAHSGLFIGGFVQPSQRNRMVSDYWTHLFIYQRNNAGHAVLFDSYSGGSGYTIGMTATNNVYFSSDSERGPQTLVSKISSPDKSAFAVVKADGAIAFYHLRPDVMSVYSDAARCYPFLENASYCRLGSNYGLTPDIARGYLDEYAYLNLAADANLVKSLFSGMFSQYTVSAAPVSYTGYIGITGYRQALTGITGVTGYQYSTTPTGYDTFGDPMFSPSGIAMTGYIMSGLAQIPMTGWINVPMTGAASGSFVVDTGFILKTFGYNKISFIHQISPDDAISAVGYQKTIGDTYNKTAEFDSIKGKFEMDAPYRSGDIMMFRNGVLQKIDAISGVVGLYSTTPVTVGDCGVTGHDILFATPATYNETVVYDLAYADIRAFGTGHYNSGELMPVTPTAIDRVFVNGLLQYSGLDYSISGASGYWNRDVDGEILFSTLYGQTVDLTGNPPLRNFVIGSSQVFRNGARQTLGSNYVESSTFSLLGFSGIFETVTDEVYNTEV